MNLHCKRKNSNNAPLLQVSCDVSDIWKLPQTETNGQQSLARLRLRGSAQAASHVARCNAALAALSKINPTTALRPLKSGCTSIVPPLLSRMSRGRVSGACVKLVFVIPLLVLAACATTSREGVQLSCQSGGSKIKMTLKECKAEPIAPTAATKLHWLPSVASASNY